MSDDGYRRQRHLTPSGDLKYISRYPIEGAELQDLIQRQPDVAYTQVLDLGTAQTPQSPLEVPVPGRVAVIHGFLTANAYNPATNTGQEPAEISAFVQCRMNIDRAENAVFMRHNRGYRGTFNKLFLSWPAQAGVSARLTVLKYDSTPWMEDSDLGSTGRTDGSSLATSATFVAGVASSQILTSLARRKVATLSNYGPGIVYFGDVNVTLPAGGFGGAICAVGSVAYHRNTTGLYVISTLANTRIGVNEEA